MGRGGRGDGFFGAEGAAVFGAGAGPFFVGALREAFGKAALLPFDVDDGSGFVEGPFAGVAVPLVVDGAVGVEDKSFAIGHDPAADEGLGVWFGRWLGVGGYFALDTFGEGLDGQGFVVVVAGICDGFGAVKGGDAR